MPPWDGGSRYVLEVRALAKRLEDARERGCLRVHSWQLAVPNDVMFSLVHSYIHMTNNRLGLTIAEEAYLASLLAASDVSGRQGRSKALLARA